LLYNLPYMETLQILFFIILLSTLLISLVVIIIIGVLQIYSRAISSIPLVPVRRQALKTINEALGIKAGDILYDLGSGDGRVLAYTLQNNPELKAVGLEIGPWPRLVSKIKLKKYGSRVEIKNEDFFKAELSQATHIFIYLYPPILKKLEPVFDKKLTPGTRVISCDFKFENKTADKIIVIPENKTLSKTMYVYNW
jgi:hypothetical protein